MAHPYFVPHQSTSSRSARARPPVVVASPPQRPGFPGRNVSAGYGSLFHLRF